MELKRYYDDFSIGDSATSPGRTVTETDIFRAAGFEYGGRVHVDREYMVNESEFDDIIVQNSVLISLSNSLWGELPGWNYETPVAYGRDNMRFVNPAYPGDTLWLDAEVTDLRIREKDRDADKRRGVITINEKLMNQRDELVMINDHHTLLPFSPDYQFD